MTVSSTLKRKSVAMSAIIWQWFCILKLAIPPLHFVLERL
jgi:hypothetical protein